LQSGAVLKTLDLVDKIAAEVKFCEADQSVEIRHSSDQIIGQVEHSEFRKVVDVLYFVDLVAVQIEYV